MLMAYVFLLFPLFLCHALNKGKTVEPVEIVTRWITRALLGQITAPFVPIVHASYVITLDKNLSAFLESSECILIMY